MTRIHLFSRWVREPARTTGSVRAMVRSSSFWPTFFFRTRPRPCTWQVPPTRKRHLGCEKRPSCWSGIAWGMVWSLMVRMPAGIRALMAPMRGVQSNSRRPSPAVARSIFSMVKVRVPRPEVLSIPVTVPLSGQLQTERRGARAMGSRVMPMRAVEALESTRR